MYLLKNLIHNIFSSFGENEILGRKTEFCKMEGLMKSNLNKIIIASEVVMVSILRFC